MKTSVLVLFFTVFLVALASDGLHAQFMNVDDIGSKRVTSLMHTAYSFPNSVPTNFQAYNDVWGFVDSMSNEYAIVGTRANTLIYRIDSDSMVLRATVANGGFSIWRDMKYYKGYIYGIVDGGSNTGLYVIDVRNIHLDGGQITAIDYSPRIPDGLSNMAPLRRGHNIFIDERGYLFVSGSDVVTDGIHVFDLNRDPLNPPFVTTVSSRYSHDVFVQNGLLGTADILDGLLRLYDVSNIDSVVFLGQVRTSGFFTHNVWFSDDNHFAFTTDEIGNGKIDSYDIRDPDDIRRLDSYSPYGDIPRGGIPHNVHYHDGYLVTSYYTEGLVVLDVKEPEFITQVAYYDSSPDYGPGTFNGCWGAFPYLPSGRVLASDIENGLFVLDVDYQRASYTAFRIYDSITKEPIGGAHIRYNTSNGLDILGESKSDGRLARGLDTNGVMTWVIEAAGYIPQTLDYEILRGSRHDIAIALLDTTNLSTSNPNVTEEPSVRIPSFIRNELSIFSTDPSSIVHIPILEIYNLHGQKMYTATNLIGDANIDVSFLPQGFYFLHFQLENSGSTTQRTKKILRMD